MNVVDDLKILTGNKDANEKSDNSSLPKKTVLIVEDETQLASVLEEKLVSEGFRVLKATDGEKGLDTATLEKPDLIILDLLMPNMDGKTMLHKLREDPECKKIPVLVLTNAGEIENIRETQFYSDAAEFLIKSNVSLEEIVAKVKTHTLATYIKP